MNDQIVWAGWIVASSIGVMIGSFLPPVWATALAGILSGCACWKILSIREALGQEVNDVPSS